MKRLPTHSRPFSSHEEAIRPQLYSAVTCGQVLVVQDILNRYRAELQKKDILNYFLEVAAYHNQVEVMSYLVEVGADIHSPKGHGNPPAPEGIIYEAAKGGAFDAVKWCLDRGAKIKFTFRDYPGESRCLPLTSAVHSGYLEVVKLLVEQGGANINALWGSMTPLSYAIMYGQKKIEEYLRSKGALEPWQIKGENPPGTVKTIHEHLRKNLGKLKPLSLHEIVPGDPPLTIHVVQRKKKPKYVTLVTEGMSSKPMTVPEGGQHHHYAELLMYLPAWWSKTELTAPENAWILEWLRRLARYVLCNY